MRLQSVERSLRDILPKAWRGLKLALEVIGVLPTIQKVDHEAQLALFRLYHTEFRKLLSANNSFLETLAELEGKRRGGGFIDREYIKRKAIRCLADVHAMTSSIENISNGRYNGLGPALQRITASVLSVLEESSISLPGKLIMDLDEIRASHADLVGGKMANLGEARNALGLPTPGGFVITVEGFRLLLEGAGLRSWIQDRHLSLVSGGMVDKASKEIVEKILGARIPEALLQEIEEALDRMERKLSRPLKFSVRSSALGEDSTLSFAGQFRSLLQVSRVEVPKAYLEVVASLFSPEAIHYRILHGIPAESAEMAVGVLEMVPAKAAGVIFSRDPTRPDSREVVIQTIRGLGVALVEGRASPETILVEDPLGPRPKIRKLQNTPGPSTSLVSRKEENPSILDDDEALKLAAWAWKLEDHFGTPQDIEFAVSEEGDAYLLQSRPLRLLKVVVGEAKVLDDFKVLLEGGETACPGVASGVAVALEEDGNLENFPEGGILIARRSSPRFIKVMSKVKAIVTDSGSTTGHMASLARELGIPALLNTGKATSSIEPGKVVTVDASARVVYEGDLASVIVAERGSEKPLQMEAASVKRGPDMELLDKVLEHISPLTLTDPTSPEFSPDNARTLHDLARYIHEKSYQEMFGLGERLGEMRPVSYLLDVFLPIDLYILDLGGGLKEVPSGGKVKLSQIACIPLGALLKGMLHEKMPRFGPRFMDLGGFFSVMMRHATTAPEEERSFRDPCYALISDHYLNYTARVGYHFSVLDTYCSPTPNKNYVSLTFRGGAADYTRRVRRAWAIEGVLRHLGFSVALEHDCVNARLGKASLEETKEKLEMVGRMLQFFRQMDAAMTTDDHARMFQEAFIRGDYDLSQTLGKNSSSRP